MVKTFSRALSRVIWGSTSGNLARRTMVFCSPRDLSERGTVGVLFGGGVVVGTGVGVLVGSGVFVGAGVGVLVGSGVFVGTGVGMY